MVTGIGFKFPFPVGNPRFFSEEDFATETKETIFDGANKVKY